MADNLSRLDRLRQKQAGKIVQAPVQLTQAPRPLREETEPVEVVKDDPPRKKPAKSPKQEKTPAETVTYLCGHTEPVVNFKSRNCHGCAVKLRTDRATRKADRGEAQRAWKFRLPHGTTFGGVYDEQTQTWEVVLEALIDGEAVRLTGKEPSIERALRNLGRQCNTLVLAQSQEKRDDAQGLSPGVQASPS